MNTIEQLFKANVIDIIEPLVSQGYVTEAFGIVALFVDRYPTIISTEMFITFARKHHKWLLSDDVIRINKACN
jgi:hypothetical protein